MLFDERVTDLLDRKYEFVAQASDESFGYELTGFLKWAFTEDLIRPYAMEVLRSDEREADEFRRAYREAFAAAVALRDELVALSPSALDAEAAITEPSAAYDVSLRFFEERRRDYGDTPHENVVDDPSEEDTTAVFYMLRALEHQVRRLRPHDKEMGARIHQMGVGHVFHYRAHVLERSTSPALSFRKLCHLARMLNPPPSEVPDWMPFLDPGAWEMPELRSTWQKEQYEGEVRVGRQHLKRVHLALRAVLGDSLSSQVLVDRFKERCVLFDRAEMRRLAEARVRGDVRENRLTLALARYLHDNGVYALVRPRIGHLEPDLVAPLGRRRLAIECKVYGDRDRAPGTVRTGFSQLHSYLVSLDTKTTWTPEGFLVVFRLGGPLCETPAAVLLERYRIHIVHIDLGGLRSGHKQPRMQQVSTKDLIDTAKASDSSRG